jgi:hypothetical protein
MNAKKEAILRELIKELNDDKKQLLLEWEKMERKIQDKEVEIGQAKKMLG